MEASRAHPRLLKAIRHKGFVRVLWFFLAELQEKVSQKNDYSCLRLTEGRAIHLSIFFFETTYAGQGHAEFELTPANIRNTERSAEEPLRLMPVNNKVWASDVLTA